MNVVTYTRPDGGVSVMIPAKAVGDGELQALIAKDIPGDATNIQVVDARSLPGRTFRDAWKFDGQAVKPDLTIAREIAKKAGVDAAAAGSAKDLAELQAAVEATRR